MIRIVVDAMGGDYAPHEPIVGAVDALKKNKDLTVILVGDEAQIKGFPVLLREMFFNLIDNAVEACRGIPEEAERFLRIYMCIRKQQLYISVSNATNEVIRKLDAEYISKKRGDHGHGLKRINIVVDKYGGFIKRANEPGVFATEIMLPL